MSVVDAAAVPLGQSEQASDARIVLLVDNAAAFLAARLSALRSNSRSTGKGPTTAQDRLASGSPPARSAAGVTRLEAPSNYYLFQGPIRLSCRLSSRDHSARGWSSCAALRTMVAFYVEGCRLVLFIQAPVK